MKKVLLVLVVMIGFSISISATEPFRWSGCNKDQQRIELYDDGNALFVDVDGTRHEATYSWSKKDGQSGSISIHLKAVNQTLRGDVFAFYGFVASDWSKTYIDIEGERFGRNLCK